MLSEQKRLDIIVSTEIEASCEKVFDYLCNPNSWPEWLAASERIESEDRVLEPGDTFYERYGGPQGGMDVHWTVLKCDRPRRWDISCHVDIAGPVVIRYDFEQKGTSCVFTRSVIMTDRPGPASKEEIAAFEHESNIALAAIKANMERREREAS